MKNSFLKGMFEKRFFKSDLAIAMVFALLFAIFLNLSVFESRCDSLRNGVLRLHILANSDSEYDQSIKLKVRDRLLECSKNWFEQSDNKQQAIEIAEKHMPQLQAEAEAILAEENSKQQVKVSIGKAWFNTRKYDNFTLPAGEYDAVRVLLGNAQGKNWWCVMFPSMCIPAAENKHSLQEAVDGDAARIANEPENYEIRFKTIEICEKIINSLKNAKK